MIDASRGFVAIQYGGHDWGIYPLGYDAERDDPCGRGTTEDEAIEDFNRNLRAQNE